MVMDSEPAKLQMGRYASEICGKGVGANSQYGLNVVKGGATADVGGLEI